MPFVDAPWHGAIDAGRFRSWIKRHPEWRFPLKVRSRGDCPRCDDETQGEDWLWELTNFVAPDDDPELVADIEQELVERFNRGERPPAVHVNRMVCACRTTHTVGKVGCGARWDLIVREKS